MNSEQAPYIFSATLRISDVASLHDEITSTTGLDPTRCHIRGEPRYPTPGCLETWPHDMWILDSPFPEAADLSHHLEWLREKLYPHKEYLKKLVGKGAGMDIFCGFTTESETAEFSIQPEALRLAYELDISLEVSVFLL